jgi:hypothetical protein
MSIYVIAHGVVSASQNHDACSAALSKLVAFCSGVHLFFEAICHAFILFEVL